MDTFGAAVSRPSAGGSTGAESIRAFASAAILPVTVGLVCFATVAQGGFYRSQGSFFAAALLALALASVSSASGLIPLLAGSAVLAAGLATSALATEWGPNAPQILAALGAGTAIVPVTRHLIARGDRTRLLEAVSRIGAGASLVGMIGVALHRAPWALRAGHLWRNSSTLTYANAAGCLFVLTLGASILLLAERPTTGRRLVAFLTLTGLATTLSRGAVVGCVVAVLVLAALGKAGVLRCLLRPAMGALCAFASLLPSIAGRPNPWLALAGGLAGAVLAARPGRRRPARTRFAILALLLVTLGAVFAASPGARRVYERRALPNSETRLRTWENSWKLALAEPALGYGPGTFSIVEEDERTGPVLTRYVHNEYLQAFFETGAIGLATVIGALGIFGAWAWRRRRTGDVHWALACALCAGFAVHSAFDFIWRLPVLVAFAFMWLAVAVTPPPDIGGTS
jgi:hypothetical protein